MSKRFNRFRKWVGQLHLILGLASGAVVFIVAITGCCWVFQEEIQSLLGRQHAIEPLAQEVITPTEAKAIAEQTIPGRSIHGVLYGAADEAVEVIFYEAEPEEFYQAVLLHPYSGEVLATEDYMSGFFAFVLDGHLNLWLPESIGNQIIRWACVIFVIMLITGIVLWWPRNKRNRKQRFQFVWKPSTRWKRKNYDLHSIVGFYVSVLALIVAFTGLVMAFESVEEATYALLGGEKELAFLVPDNVSPAQPQETGTSPAIDRLLPQLQAEFPEAQQFEFHYPHTDEASIYVELTYDRGVYYSSDYRFYDQYTLEEINTPSVYGRYEEAGFSDLVIRMNYDIHVGAIGGLPGKILLFLVSLVVASLPVTGFLVWWGRKQKAAQRVKPRVQIA